MITVCAVSTKGGVGKTTTLLALALAASRRGIKSILIDMDDQANASGALIDLSNADDKASAFSLITNKKEFEPHQVDDFLYVAYASHCLLGLDEDSYETYFALSENISESLKDFDLVLIDTAGTLKSRVGAALAASDFVYSPIELTQFALQAFEPLNNVITNVKKRFNQKMNFLGFVPNRVDQVRFDNGVPYPYVNSERDIYNMICKDIGEEKVLGVIGQRKNIRESLQIGQHLNSNDLATKEINTFTNNVLTKIGF